MNALRFSAVLCQGENSKSSACNHTACCLSFPPSFHVHLSPDHFNPLETLASTTFTFITAQESYVASAWTTMGPTRVLNFPAVWKKKKKKRATTATIVWGNGRSPAPWILPSQSTHGEHELISQPADFLHIFYKKTLLTQSRLSIQVFSHFPLSFDSAVAPSAPPPAPRCPAHAPPPPRGSRSSWTLDIPEESQMQMGETSATIIIIVIKCSSNIVWRTKEPQVHHAM